MSGGGSKQAAELRYVVSVCGGGAALAPPSVSRRLLSPLTAVAQCLRFLTRHWSQVALPAAGSNEWASMKSRAGTGTAEVCSWFPSAAARALSDVILLELGLRPRPRFGSRACIFLILGKAV